MTQHGKRYRQARGLFDREALRDGDEHKGGASPIDDGVAQPDDPLVSPFEKPTRIEALRYYRKVVDAYDLSHAAGGYRYVPYVSSSAFEKTRDRSSEY